VTKENLDKVREGMTVQEVEAVLGPGLDTGVVDDAILETAEKELKLPPDILWKRWRNPDSPKPNFAAVAFSGGKVVAKTSSGL
jgi:hypothetical protein